jgi:hypothetical protein
MNVQGQASPISPAPAQILSKKAMSDGLKMIHVRAFLNDVPESASRLIKAHRNDMLCSIVPYAAQPRNFGSLASCLK